MTSILHPLVATSQTLIDRIVELERIKTKCLEEVKREAQLRSELEDELKILHGRLGELDRSILQGEEERVLVRAKVQQGRTAKQKIEEGMRLLLETLEREERVVRRAGEAAGREQ